MMCCIYRTWICSAAFSTLTSQLAESCEIIWDRKQGYTSEWLYQRKLWASDLRFISPSFFWPFLMIMFPMYWGDRRPLVLLPVLSRISCLPEKEKEKVLPKFDKRSSSMSNSVSCKHKLMGLIVALSQVSKVEKFKTNQPHVLQLT